MFINRIILIVLIIASGIFVSNYGGNVSYGFFYITLSVPFVSLLYTLYVYTRFRLYQEVGQRVIVKGDLTPYSFTLANEDYITYRSIKVNFLYDKSTISNVEGSTEYCLLPGVSETLETKLRCNYRGDYYVGVSSVDIIDFLYLFKITYPINSKLKVTVLPRVLSLSRLDIVPPQKDIKNPPYLANGNKDLMDIETRKYQYSDGKKQIHWKVSAKKNQLFSRQYRSNPKTEAILLMDLSPINEDSLTNVIIEDKIIESTLAIANYYKDNNTGITVVYEQGGINNMVIRGKTDFDVFYQSCVNIHYNASYSVEQILKESYKSTNNNNFYILITHVLTKELYKNILEIAQKGNEISLILINDKTKPYEDMVKGFRLGGIGVKLVTREDEIQEVLKV